jgi:hypothetical protein
MATVNEYLFTLMIGRSILLRVRNFSDKICRENYNTYFMFNYFFPKIVPLTRQCGKIWYSDRGHRLQYNRLVDIAFWIIMLPTQKSEILITFPWKEWLRERACLILNCRYREKHMDITCLFHILRTQTIHLTRMYSTNLCSNTNCSCFKNVLFMHILSAVMCVTFKLLTMTYLTYDINITQSLLHYILPRGLLWWRLNGQINQHNRIYATLCQPQQRPVH